LVLAGWSSSALAGGENCRDIEFRGQSGPLSEDLVTFRVKDSAGTLLDESCDIQVKPNETGDEFAARIPAVWADGGGCPPNFGLGVAAPYPKRVCHAIISSYSCRYTVKTRRGNTRVSPPIPKTKYLRICCYEGSGRCKGKPVGSKSGSPAVFRCTAPSSQVGQICTVDGGCDEPPASGNGRCGRTPITLQTKINAGDYEPSDADLPAVRGIQLVELPGIP
jgi:hypothetical protein